MGFKKAIKNPEITERYIKKLQTEDPCDLQSHHYLSSMVFLWSAFKIKNLQALTDYQKILPLAYVQQKLIPLKFHFFFTHLAINHLFSQTNFVSPYKTAIDLFWEETFAGDQIICKNPLFLLTEAYKVPTETAKKILQLHTKDFFGNKNPLFLTTDKQNSHTTPSDLFIKYFLAENICYFKNFIFIRDKMFRPAFCWSAEPHQAYIFWEGALNTADDCATLIHEMAHGINLLQSWQYGQHPLLLSLYDREYKALESEYSYFNSLDNPIKFTTRNFYGLIKRFQDEQYWWLLNEHRMNFKTYCDRFYSNACRPPFVDGVYIGACLNILDLYRF